MKCEHATRVNKHAVKCGLGLFGGVPSPGVCRTCQHYKGADSTPVPAPLPGPLDMIKNFVASAGEWSKAGFPVVDEAEHEKRVSACAGCPEWEGEARLGLGKCKACGCTGLKRWLETEACPKGLW